MSKYFLRFIFYVVIELIIFTLKFYLFFFLFKIFKILIQILNNFHLKYPKHLHLNFHFFLRFLMLRSQDVEALLFFFTHF
jgi:hypothetical protein